MKKDPDAAARMTDSGGSGDVPFVNINGKTIEGFSAQAYGKTLGLL